MLITLGPWVEEPDTWDESLWGGSGTARRRGRGYYEGMTDQELLDASRLFWRFQPDSGTWEGIQVRARRPRRNRPRGPPDH